MLEKLITKLSKTKRKIDKSCEKVNIALHPSNIPFLTALEPSDDNKTLQVFIAPVNYNKVNESKTVQITHTLMGNFCHGDMSKANQPEDMGNDKCIMIAYHAKVSYCYLQQHILIWNYLLGGLSEYHHKIDMSIHGPHR